MNLLGSRDLFLTLCSGVKHSHTILLDHVSYKAKPRVIRVWIFALDPLIIDPVIKTRLKLGLSLYKV